MLQVGRNDGDYRFGFNTQEKDNEIAGKGNSNTALFWEYDTRLGRRWSIDPKPSYGISGYAVFRNNSKWFNDILGDKFKVGSEDQSKEDVKSIC